MKQINKKEPDFYAKYLKKESPTEWKTLSQAIGSNVREHILDIEQNNQCAYTEIALDHNSRNSHIDHFKKRALFPEETFNWNNLLVSCNRENYGAKYKDKHIHKQDYNNILNPTIDNPSSFFHYSFTGNIGEKTIDKINGERVANTISLFGLNNKSLVERRATIAEQVKIYSNQLSLPEIKEVIGEFDSFVENIYSTLHDDNISVN
ncbi:MAG: TIGR02646 family protein [Bacteroidales bacterium]|nr:TIGR02646 family protein [Bacteroidales bacterium]